MASLILFIIFMSSTLKTVLPDSHLTLHYRISLENGQDIANTFHTQPATLLLGHHQLAFSLEQNLLGMSEGQREHWTLAPLQAFGQSNPKLLQYVSWEAIRAGTKDDEPFLIGDWIELNTPEAVRMVGQLKSYDDQAVLLDFNHPLAGRTIQFEVQIIAIL